MPNRMLLKLLIVGDFTLILLTDVLSNNNLHKSDGHMHNHLNIPMKSEFKVHEWMEPTSHAWNNCKVLYVAGDKRGLVHFQQSFNVFL